MISGARQADAEQSIICLVTPGAAPSSAATAEARAKATAGLIEQAVNAGVDLVQVREPDLPGRLLAELVRMGVRASRGTRTRMVVNDRVDVALACGADGVHLGARSLPPARVRVIAPRPFLIGSSIHSVGEAQTATAEGAVDYLIAGTVFASASKPGETRLLGVAGLSAVVSATALPVLAIGGIDLDVVRAVAGAGARGFAAIRLFADAAAGSRLDDVVRRARSMFDTTRVIP